jgi:outer membrane lipoprotein-sorting protein
MRFLFLVLYLLFLTLPCEARTPEEIVNKLNENFTKIKNAQAEIALDTSLQILGCGGVTRQKGTFFFKAPDKIKCFIGRDEYYVKGNSIRKIDAERKRYYIRLIHAPDFSMGFSPRLVTHNFNLKIVKETTDEVIMEGIPKPGVLKNTKKVVFHVDTKENLLRSMDISLSQGFKGRAFIKYEKIGGLWVPVQTFGKSALEINGGFLAAFIFDLKGKNFKINAGLPDKAFEPGF